MQTISQFISTVKNTRTGVFVLDYASMNGSNPMNRAYLIAVESFRWFFLQTPVRFDAIIFPVGVKNLRKISMSL